MTRPRGRPIKPIPVHPERVISRAVQAGLSITVELQRNITNQVTRKHYESSQSTWTKYRRAYQTTGDYTYIRKAEPSVVDNNHKVLFENAAKYGFTEVSRQKNSDGTVGPINQRMNACGAALRVFSQCSFPFPNPTDFGTQKYTIGQDTMEFRLAGYEVSSFGPRVTLAHPDLPSMDFGDAVRSHNEFIATFCAIHDVDVRETTRYSNLFLLLVRPYLEYLYSEYTTGKPGFQKGVYHALRRIKELVRKAGFVPTMYKDKRTSRDFEFHSPDANLEFFDDQLKKAETLYGSKHPVVTEVRRLRDGGVTRSYALNDPNDPEEACLTVKDVEYIREKAVQRAVLTGSKFHRRIAALFPSPWNVNDVIFNGDRYAQDSKYIIVSEMPVQTENGVLKIDLVHFERTISEDGKSIFWEPRQVYEIKTRKKQRWWVEPDFKKSEVRTIQRAVSDILMADLPMNGEMWEAIINSTPRPSTQRQLDTYAHALSDAFKRSTKRELGKILTGTVIVDSTSDLDSARRTVEQLIVYAFERMRGRRRRIKRTVFEPEGDDRIALVVHDQEPPVRKDTQVVKAPWESVYNPFKGKRDSEREFILYLSGKFQTSGGQSAAWHGKYHHGLQMLHEIQTSKNATDFVWMDLADQFSDPGLAEVRLRLRPRGYSEEELAKTRPDHIREFFEGIEVRRYLDSILSFLYEDDKAPEFTLKKRRKKNTHRVIVISGADTLRDATPTSHRDKLKIVMDRLLNSLPDDSHTTLVWFDSPVPSVDKALPYSGRALLPFYDGDSLSEVVTEIVWNLPVAPIGAVQPDRWRLPIIGDSPMHDDIRVIVRHSHSGLSTELTHVPFLRGWSKRFRNKGRGLVVLDRQLHDVVPEKRVRDRMKLLALTHIPWLVRLWPDEPLFSGSKKTLKELFRRLDRQLRRHPRKRKIRGRKLGELTRAPTILDLLSLRLPDIRDAKSYAALTVGKINSQRLYRSPNRLLTQPLREQPPSIIQPEEAVVPEELTTDTVFGIKFEYEGDLSRPWWLVVQDPNNESRILVGCFTHRLPAKNGFHWAETGQEILTEFSVEDILGLTQNILTGSMTETWLSMVGSDQATSSGTFEVIGSRGRSTVGYLRAFRSTPPEVSQTRTISDTLPTESFYGRVVDSLRRYIDSVRSSTPVTLSLEMVEDRCRVTFTDEEDEVLHIVTLEYTADLFSLLRRPMTQEGPMYTDSGNYVNWSVFENIEYGELDFLEPYITLTAARKVPEELPRRIIQFFEEAETVKVSFEHDHTVCPMVTEEEGVDHGECWRNVLPSDCPEPVRRQLGQAMTGEEVNGLLSPRKLFTRGKLYMFDITAPTVSEKDDSVVFYENKYIRMLLRRLGMSSKQISPGTYLQVSGQDWYVGISWRDREHLEWKARSAVSGLFVKGGSRTIKLEHGKGHGAKKECARILKLITSGVPDGRVANLTQVEEALMSGLRTRGYSSKSSPPCELRVIVSTESAFSFGVFPVGGRLDESYVDITIKVDSGELQEQVLSGIDYSFEEGDLSHYKFRNKDSFKKKIAAWVRRNISVIEWTEESEEEQEYVEPDYEEGLEPEYEEGLEEEQVDEETEWEVTLYVTKGTKVVSWEATQNDSDEYQGGILNVDKKVLLDDSEEIAEQWVRDVIEDEVMPELVHISNLEDVLDKQVPQVIRELRELKE